MGCNWSLCFCQAAVEAEILAAGFEHAAFGRLCKVSSCLQWWQLTWLMLRLSAKINREWWTRTATLKNRLESDGGCKGTEEPRITNVSRSSSSVGNADVLVSTGNGCGDSV